MHLILNEDGDLENLISAPVMPPSKRDGVKMWPKGAKACFLDKSRLKTRHTHHGRCAPAGGATHGTPPPGWLCTLQVGPGSAAGCAQPALCQPWPSGPPPSSAPAPAADALACSRLRATFRDKVRPKCCSTWTCGLQNVSCMGAHTVLWVRLELFQWVQGSFSAPSWVCLSPHKSNAVPFGALWCCHKQRRQTDGEAAMQSITKSENHWGYKIYLNSWVYSEITNHIPLVLSNII